MSISKLLIFRIGHLGDTVISLPALWAVRRHFPEARITLLTNIDRENPEYTSPADVLPKSGLIDDFVAYPTDPGAPGILKAVFQLAIRLRRERYDRVLYLMPRVRSKVQIRRDRVFFRVAGIPETLGIKFLDKNRLEYPVTFPADAVESESEFLLQLVNEIGIPHNAIETDLLLTDSEISCGEGWLADATQGRVETNLIAVAMGGKWNFKCWSESKFHKVVLELIKQKDCFPILFGGTEDREKGDRLIGALGSGANAAGKLSVRESAAVLGKCKLYLGNDTGTMHLAAAVGVPCVAMFSLMDFVGRWNPFGDHNRIFRSESRCGGCLSIGGTISHTCMESIGVDEVLEASLNVLDRA